MINTTSDILFAAAFSASLLFFVCDVWLRRTASHWFWLNLMLLAMLGLGAFAVLYQRGETVNRQSMLLKGAAMRITELEEQLQSKTSR